MFFFVVLLIAHSTVRPFPEQSNYLEYLAGGHGDKTDANTSEKK